VTGTTVAVAAGVLLRADGAVLLGQRPQGKVYAGYWEFPGGKVEPGETAHAALERELHEELGIRVTGMHPWFVRTFTYPHARVRIRFFRVDGWEGEPHAREHAALAWQVPERFTVSPMLPANTPILRALQLPSEYAVSNAAAMGVDAFLAALERRLRDGLRLVQLRENSLPPASLRTLAATAAERCRAHGARLLVNGDVDLARAVGAAGVQLSAARVRALDARPPVEWVGASCHDAAELARAAGLGADFVVLGPVQSTPTHPDARVLGWPRFAALAEEAELPVFAIGGLRRTDLARARAAGAHGIAMIRGAWA